MNYSNEEDFSDSPIYQAILTKEKETVECLLSRNLSNRRQMKQALSLARTFQLDEIIGLLLKALGLDRQRRFLNLGGLDLVEIKPQWIYPSLGLRSCLKPLHRHRRHKSMEYVAEIIKRRNSVDNSAILSNIESSLAMSSSDRFSKSQNELGIRSMLVAAGGVAMLPTFSDLHRNKSPVESIVSSGGGSSVISKEIPSRYRQRHAPGASRPPRLPTVLSSPLATVKSSSLPSMSVNMENFSTADLSPEADQEQLMFTGSIQKNEAEDFIDGPKEMEEQKMQEAGNIDVERIPERRHIGKTASTTGATHVPFSTLARYQQYNNDSNPTGSITSLIDHSQDELLSETRLYSLDSKLTSQLRPGSKLVKRAALKSVLIQDKKRSFVNSTSPFASSDEQGSTETENFSFSFSLPSQGNEIHKSTEKPSSTSPEGEDLVDGPPSLIPPLSSIEPPPSPSSVACTPNVASNLKTIIYLDLSSNKLKGLESLVEDSRRIVKCLKDMNTMDLKQNSLTELPIVLMEVRL